MIEISVRNILFEQLKAMCFERKSESLDVRDHENGSVLWVRKLEQTTAAVSPESSYLLVER